MTVIVTGTTTSVRAFTTTPSTSFVSSDLPLHSSGMLPFPIKTVAAIAAAMSIPSIRQHVFDTLKQHLMQPSWKTAAIVFAILNLKSLPFVWHIRVLGALIRRLYVPLDAPIAPHQLFQPVIVPSRSPLLEIDYYLHKSNSTYFSDLDEARTALVTTILRNGIRTAATDTSEARVKLWREGLGRPDLRAVPPGKVNIYLGSVSCQFRREIPAYRKVEIWSRLLSWDRKWMYWASYMVDAGVSKPTFYSQQAWKKGRGERAESVEDRRERRERARKSVYAVSIAKSVCKKGRLTIPPELALALSGMLPEKPEGAPAPSNLPTYHGSESATPASSTDDVLEESLFPGSSASAQEWTWQRIEAERMKGLKFAELFGGLDGLADTFDGGDGPALNEHRNWFSM